MNDTRETDKNTYNRYQESCPTSVVPALIARRLEHQRNAYAETLREIHTSGMCGNVVFTRHPELSGDR